MTQSPPCARAREFHNFAPWAKAPRRRPCGRICQRMSGGHENRRCHAGCQTRPPIIFRFNMVCVKVKGQIFPARAGRKRIAADLPPAPSSDAPPAEAGTPNQGLCARPPAVFMAAAGSLTYPSRHCGTAGKLFGSARTRSRFWPGRLGAPAKSGDVSPHSQGVGAGLPPRKLLPPAGNRSEIAARSEASRGRQRQKAEGFSVFQDVSAYWLTRKKVPAAPLGG